MKTLIFLLFFFTFSSAFSQRNFYRIYNRSNSKFAAGSVTAIRDSALLLNTKEGLKTISVEKIGQIRSGHSSAPNILGGMLLGGITGGIIYYQDHASLYRNYSMMAQDQPESNPIPGIFLGVLCGTAAGVLSVAFKNVNIYEINGNIKSLHNAFPEK